MLHSGSTTIPSYPVEIPRNLALPTAIHDITSDDQVASGVLNSPAETGDQANHHRNTVPKILSVSKRQIVTIALRTSSVRIAAASAE